MCFFAKEIIFEDFSCAFSEGILKHGRMFIAENYICFYATVLGLKTKVTQKREWLIDSEASSQKDHSIQK